MDCHLSESHSRWFWYMSHFPHEFVNLVSEVSFIDSVCDECVREAESLRGFRCERCPRKLFKSQKALWVQERVVHKTRTEMRWYADSSGVCPICETNFRSRFGLLAHQNDRRRPRCASEILYRKLPKLSEERVDELDLLDRRVRTDARRAGHSCAIAVCPTIKKDGTFTGHVQN